MLTLHRVRVDPDPASMEAWSEVYRHYYGGLAAVERWLSTQVLLSGDETGAQEGQQGAEQTEAYSEVRDQLAYLKEVNPTRIPVTFTLTPEEQEQEELSDVPEAIPLSFYLWQAEGQWHLRQVLPGGPFTNTVPIREGQTEPPAELFAELDSKLRFPKGTLRYQIPGGEEAEVQVTGEMTAQEILGWVALALGLAALAATGVGALAGGAGLAALAGSAKGVAFTLAVGSTVAGAGSSGLSLGEQFQHGNPDGMQVTLDVVGLASSVLSLGSLVTGRIVTSQAARGTAIGNLAGRSYIPLVAGTVAADAAGLTLLVVEAPGQIQAVMEGEGTEEEKLRALAVLLSQLAVSGVLTQISLQGDLADIHNGGVLGIDVENGVSVGRVGGEADARLETRAELSEVPEGGGSTRIEEPEGNASTPNFSDAEASIDLSKIAEQPDATDAYSRIRSVSHDVDLISDLTGIPVEEVAQAKQHFMFDKHILIDEEGNLYRGRFEPYEDVAELWEKIIDGKPLSKDEIDYMRCLIRHEHAESALMRGEAESLEQAFQEGKLEDRLRQFLANIGWEEARINRMISLEPKPITPYRYSHLIVSLSGSPNP